MKECEQAYLDGLLNRLATACPVPVASTILEGSAVAEALNSHATATGSDLIVMTTHGHGPLSRFWLGSVADEMVRRAVRPLLLVRPQASALDLASEPALQHILIPLDGTALAERALASAVGLGNLMQARYTLLRAYGPEIDLDPLSSAALGDVQPSGEQLRCQAQDYLNRTAEQLKGQALNVQMHVVLGQHPASAILEAAQRLGADLIALESHGRHGLSRMLLGSVADKVIRGASLPVLVHSSPGK